MSTNLVRSLAPLPQGAAALTCVALLLTLTALAGSFAANMIQLNMKIALNAQQKLQIDEQVRSTLNNSIGLLQSSLTHNQQRDDAFDDERYSYHIRHQVIEDVKTPAASLVGLSATVALQDSATQASHRQTLVSFALLNQIPAAPLMASGVILNNQKATLVTNANGAGENIPVSVWTPMPIDNTQNLPTTCPRYEFNQSRCTSGWLTRAGFRGADIIDSAEHFPEDLLQYLSPFSMQDWQYYKDLATEVLTHCDNLTHLSNGLIWIEGDCMIPMGEDIGNPESPVILVVKDGDISMPSGLNLYGVIILLQQNQQQLVKIDVFDSASVYGSIISTAGVEFSRDPINIIYDADVLSALQTLDLTRRLTPLPGSWRDF